MVLVIKSIFHLLKDVKTSFICGKNGLDLTSIILSENKTRQNTI